MFAAFRCEICGETYLGYSKPENCPYCGAHEEYLKSLENYERVMPKKVTDESHENVLKAIDLEIDNAKFYACAARETEDELEAAVFKRLGKIEAEHAEALAEVIDVPEKDIPSYEECSTDSLENYREAHEREERAIKAYSKFASEAKEPEIKELFEAIVEIEKDHLALSERKTTS
ncbi:hypothetical protein AKJ37_04390 [candidate division MSBL1 archaeon SCGC-AAA259I09]|uniref:Uncharacterized protein n=3 Tax=candidate division MSBL1 TaxID=215777 RepID=A0A133URG7_9EURY|nr:hypothetical protein AKJ36_02890 [candidate division MSBL1 archaeon SCGC-AAA259I07]KXA96788.1 hypothetical protein AKJ37_04390 [candidate division MSBL1 archaeon SCGC-AAA259I09]KXB00868.1 hypothetical protein AKJ40_00055 [candidate division MSBL1 archaeon SCGC-AAA259M10]